MDWCSLDVSGTGDIVADCLMVFCKVEGKLYWREGVDALSCMMASVVVGVAKFCDDVEVEVRTLCCVDKEVRNCCSCSE